MKKSEKENYPIDAVILWVDGNDPEWQKEKNKYLKKYGKEIDAGNNRYRENGWLKYIFRGIEKYAPWIRKVFLVTCGHYPSWLNLECPKLQLVRHADFIPQEYLPTFSSRSIDLQLWKIPELSEHFIYFNDDMFLTNFTSKRDFFRNGLPCNMFVETAVFPGNLIFNYNMLNNMKILLKYYDRRTVLKENRTKILALRYREFFVYNFMWYMFPYKKFSALHMCHLPVGHRKSHWQRVWERDDEKFIKTVSNKFRSAGDLNQFIYDFDMLLSGEFFPCPIHTLGKFYSVKDGDVTNLCNAIKSGRYKRICINDECSDEDIVKVEPAITASFEKILGMKSAYEK